MKTLIKIDGLKLKHHRLKNDITLEELGKRLGGLHKVTVNKWESEKRPVPVKYHDKICKILKISIDDIRYPTIEELNDKHYMDTQEEADQLPDDLIEAQNEYGDIMLAPLIRERRKFQNLLEKTQNDKNKWNKVGAKNEEFDKELACECIQQAIDIINQQLIIKSRENKQVQEQERHTHQTPQEMLAGAPNLHLLNPGQAHQIPVITTAQAKGWDSNEAITEIIDFEDCAQVTVFGHNVNEGWVAIQVNGDSMGYALPHGSIVVVDMHAPYPKRNKRVLAKLADSGELVVKRYQRRDNIITLESDGEGQSWTWNCKTEPPKAEWMRPIRKIIIDEY